MLQYEKNPSSIIYHSYLRMAKKLRKKDSIKQNLEILFEFMKENSLVCPNDVVNELINLGNKQSKSTTVSHEVDVYLIQILNKII